ncbi:MAG: hypothetical protein ACREDR_28410 [Blastocatellia bacterium]
MIHHFLLLFLLTQAGPSEARPCPCEPKVEIRAQIEKAAAASSAAALSTPASDFDLRVAPFLALRERYPDDLFVNQQYQDAVAQNGIEGHLKAMTEEYQALDIKNGGATLYHYLFLRSLVGRLTPAAIHGLTEIVTADPNFAPAHQTLAEIYGSPAFHDAERQKSETGKLSMLCPGSLGAVRPYPLPEPSPAIDEADKLLSSGGDFDRIISLTFEGLRSDEWRNQRIRAFDWYSVDFKRKATADLRREYWKAWAVQVRSYRKAGRPQQAAGLLASMEVSAAALNPRNPEGYWDALVTLAHLYVEGNQVDRASQTIVRMRQLIAKQPGEQNNEKTEVLNSLQKLVPNPPHSQTVTSSPSGIGPQR